MIHQKEIHTGLLENNHSCPQTLAESMVGESSPKNTICPGLRKISVMHDILLPYITNEFCLKVCLVALGARLRYRPIWGTVEPFAFRRTVTLDFELTV